MSGKDLYRDTWVRYLGYTNEIGESLRHYIGHRNVMITYAVATTYCLADAIDKTTKCWKRNEHSPRRLVKSVFTAVDVMTWQMLASVMIPGFTINRVCFFTHRFLIARKLPPQTRKILVTATGIAMIPIIIHPIDKLTDIILDNSLRLLAP